MKTIKDHLGQIILAVAAVALIVGVVLSFTTPFGNFIDNIFDKTNEQAQGNIWNNGSFSIPYKVKLTTNIAGAGTVEFTGEHSGTSVKLRGEQTLTLQATCNSGYRFLGWYVGDTLLSENLEYTGTFNKAATVVGHFDQAFGLYKTGTNYTELIYDWDELVHRQYVSELGVGHSTVQKYLAGDLLFPDTLTTIAADAFNSASKIEAPITGVFIPKTVTSIGDNAFKLCPSLTSVKFAEGSQLETIGGYAFLACTSLTEVEIPDSVTTIGTWAFQRCTSLTEIEIPAGVTSIGEYAFHNCTSLEAIIFKGTVVQWNAITKGTNWNGNVPATEVVCSDGTVTLN